MTKIITYLNQTWMRSFVERTFSEANVSADFSAQVSISLAGMMLARFGAGIAVVEPLLLSALQLPGLVARPLDPSIDVSTLLLCNRQSITSIVVDDFVGELQEIYSGSSGVYT